MQHSYPPCCIYLQHSALQTALSKRVNIAYRTCQHRSSCRGIHRAKL